MIKNFIEEITKFNDKAKFSKSSLYKGFGRIDEDGAFRKKTNFTELDINDFRINSFLALLLITLVMIAFLVRSLNIQVINREKYISLAKSNRIREISIQPERGVIFDRKGKIVARNKPAFFVQLNLQICSPDLVDLNECKKSVEGTQQLIGVSLDLERITKELEARKPVIVLYSGLEKSQILTLEANLKSFSGVTISLQPIREYAYSESFSHVLGYVGLDETNKRPIYVGKTGVEQVYDNILSGIPGTQIVQIDSTGTNFETISQKDSLPGRNVSLYLDSDLQNKAYELLKEKVVKGKPDKITGFKAEAGAIVAQDPKTGGILAIVSYPSFDANRITSGITPQEYNQLISDPHYPFFNRVVAAAYPPGSTFKMVPASAALMESVVTKDTLIYDPGYIQVGSFIFRNWKLDGHGDVNLKRALQVSNDVYFYTIGGGHAHVKGLGIEKLSTWAKKFGFGSKTGIDIDGEVAGYMPDGTGREWYLGDTFITTIGQGDVLATPLQVNNMVAYFANGGYLMVPKIVNSVDGADESEVQILSQNMVDKEYYELIREGLKAAVAPGGTGYPLFDFPIRHDGIELAGKTGTAEYIDKDGKDRTHAWFSVFGPFDDASIALTVFLEGGGGGSDDAAPIAKELLDEWFKDK